MSSTKIHTALAVAGATLGTVVPAVPAQAAVPRPPAVRLQGAAATVTMFRPAGTRNVYLRATTIKRTIRGTIIRTIKGIPIKVTLTRIIIRDGRVVAKNQVGATGQGADQATCDRFANAIDSWVDGVADAVLSGDIAAAETADNNVEGLIDGALDAGCFVITG